MNPLTAGDLTFRHLGEVVRIRLNGRTVVENELMAVVHDRDRTALRFASVVPSTNAAILQQQWSGTFWVAPTTAVSLPDIGELG